MWRCSPNRNSIFSGEPSGFGAGGNNWVIGPTVGVA